MLFHFYRVDEARQPRLYSVPSSHLTTGELFPLLQYVYLANGWKKTKEGRKKEGKKERRKRGQMWLHIGGDEEEEESIGNSGGG